MVTGLRALSRQPVLLSSRRLHSAQLPLPAVRQLLFQHLHFHTRSPLSCSHRCTALASAPQPVLLLVSSARCHISRTLQAACRPTQRPRWPSAPPRTTTTSSSCSSSSSGSSCAQHSTAMAPPLAGLAARCLLRLALRAPCAAAAAAPAAGRCLSTSAPRQQQQPPPPTAGAPADEDESMEFPGGRVPFTSALSFVGGVFDAAPKLPCYRTLDGRGQPIDGAALPHALGKDEAVALYVAMARLQVMDTIFYDAQRQGRFSFYMTCAGEEATVVGSAAGLDPKDVVFSQYREHGVLLWRGFSFDDFAHQLYGNEREPGQGRQMPIHYGSAELHYQTVSSPLATQLPHAAGAAYALKLDKAGAVAVAYFGEGASSEGDFHAAVNFAATLGAPCLFICRNNGYAISTPANEQYKGDGIAVRGPAYGVPAIRVDGGDARAMFCATREARALALAHECPVLIEAMSYRSGHHSTSDDSSRYRTREEMGVWRARDPVVRFRNLLVLNGWWDEGQEQGLRQRTRQQVIEAMEAASKVPKPPVSAMFSDVYAHMPWHLKEQLADTLALVKQHPHLLPPGMPAR